MVLVSVMNNFLTIRLYYLSKQKVKKVSISFYISVLYNGSQVQYAPTDEVTLCVCVG